MNNLLNETLEILMGNGRLFCDVIAIVGDNRLISHKDFLRLADTEYNPRSGNQVVATDLKLIGKDFWMERRANSMYEWWNFYEMPQYENLPLVKTFALTTAQSLSAEGAESFEPTIEDLNTEDEDDGENN